MEALVAVGGSLRQTQLQDTYAQGTPPPPRIYCLDTAAATGQAHSSTPGAACNRSNTPEPPQQELALEGVGHRDVVF